MSKPVNIPQAQQYICDLTPYQPGLPIDAVARAYGLNPATVVKLASNENPLGMSLKARQALAAGMGQLHRYPEQHQLVEALAAHHHVAAANIVLGNGSNDVLDLIARTFLSRGDAAVSAQYAFAIYQIATQSAGAQNIIVPAEDYGHNLEAMLQAVTSATRVVWIANPNNPTGTFVSYADVRRFLARMPSSVIVVLDEAYYEYLSPSDQANATRWLADHANLVLVRTFSKVYGLAGLRVGYGLASPEVASLLNRVRQPFNVSTAGIIAATAALADREFVAKSFKANQRSLRQLQMGLAAHRLPCLPAYGNFVTLAVPKAALLCEFLLKEGIIVRPLAAYGMPKHLRITAGTTTENNRFLAALAKWYSKEL